MKSKAGFLLRADQVAHSSVQPGLEILPGQRQQSLVGQPAPLPHCPLRKKVFPCIQFQPLFSSLDLHPLSLALPPCTTIKNLAPPS